MKKYIFTVSFFCLIFLSGCAGFSQLPEINLIGKKREDVIRIFAQNPEKSHDSKINLLIPVSPHDPLLCNGNVYFRTAQEALDDEQVKNAPAIGGYRTERFLAIPGGWDYYEVVFDKSNIAVSQNIRSYWDGP